MNSFRPVLAIFVSFMLTSGFLMSAQTLSTSKISAHFINAYTIGESNIVAGHPQVLKILDLGSGMLVEGPNEAIAFAVW